LQYLITGAKKNMDAAITNDVSTQVVNTVRHKDPAVLQRLQDTVILVTERCILSVWDESMLDYAIQLWDNIEVTRFIGGPFTTEGIEKRLQTEIANYRDFRVQYWPVFSRSADNEGGTSVAFMGCCGLRPYSPGTDCFEMGVHLLPEYWNGGYASELMVAVKDYAFANYPHIESLFAGHNPQNVRSRKMLERIGFQYVRDEFYPPTGLYHPSYIISRSSS
jgi:ribosomal-protein-alanine N-acetyltransferase